jgi:hypothetical protein
MGCKDCDASASSHQEQLKALSERAMKLALSLPDDATCYKTFKKPEAAFLSALRGLAAGYAFAHTWSESEARARAEALAFADAALTYGFQAGIAERINTGGGGGSGESCTAACTREKDACTEGCNNSPSAGYFCYFDCRLTYMACLARCITHGVFSGGGIFAA